MKYGQKVIPKRGYVTFYLLLAILTANPVWIIALMPMGAFLLLKFLYTGNPPELKITREIPQKFFHNENLIPVTLTVQNKGKTAFRGNLFDKIPRFAKLLEGTNNALIVLQPGETIQLTYGISIPKLGSFKIGPTRIFSHDFSELKTQLSETEDLSEVIVLPVPAKISRNPFTAQFLRSYGGPFETKLVGEGWDFAGVREYIHSDTLKRINWKVSSKYRKLHSNEFQIEQSAKILLVVDMIQANETLVEETSKTVMGLLDFFINNQCRTGLLVISNVAAYFPPTSSRKKLIQISQYLALSKPMRITDLNLFKQRLQAVLEKAGSQNEVLLFSPLREDTINNILIDKLSLMGRLTVFSPNYNELIPRPDDTIEEYTAKIILQIKQELTENKVKQKGVRVVTWDPTIGLDRSIGYQFDRAMALKEAQ